MALKVGGTEVVDNNRQLKNIATIDSGTVTAFNSALNTDPTKGTLTKTFTQNETAEITLNSNVSVGPVVSATKEVPQTGISSKGAWDVNSSASNYDFHNTAANVTLTPTSVSSFSGTSNANGFTQQGSAYNSEVGGAYPQAFAFADNGIKYYIANNKIVYRYDLTTAYDLSTASINTSQTFNVTSSINMDISGIYFKNDGTKYFLTFGSSSQLIYAFECATGHDISNSTNIKVERSLLKAFKYLKSNT